MNSGRWIILDDVPGACVGYRAIVDAEGVIVCNPSPMGEKNARLIANAPAMLAALRLADRALCEIRRTNLRSVPGFDDTYALSSELGALLRDIDAR